MLIYDRKSYEERRDAIIKFLKLLGVAVMLTGCAHGHAASWTHAAQGKHGQINIRQVDSSPSVCFDGLLRRWQRAGCSQVTYEKLGDGYAVYRCGGSIDDELLSQDYFVIAWNSAFHQYSRPIPEDTVAVCADPAAIIVTAESD